MSAKVVLQVISGPIRGKVFEFDRHDTFLFGRSKECHARLPKDGYVSRHHFLLEVNPPAATIRDLRSMNGTHVNGVRYGGRKNDPSTVGGQNPGPQAELKDRDVIMVGKTKIRVRVAAAAKKGQPVRQTFQADMSGQAGKPDVRAQAAGLYVPTQTEGVGEQPARESMPPEAHEGAAGLPQVPSPHPLPLSRVQARGENSPLSRVRARGENSPQPEREGDLHPASSFPVAEEAGGLRALIRQAAKDYQSKQHIEVEGYELRELLGQGSMGVVYKAIRKLDQFPVAVKVMLAKVSVHETVRKRFLREIEIIRQLGHANIVALIASGAAGNAFYFVSEYCNGGSLAELACRQGGRVPLPVLAPIILQCLKGLAHAHQHGFVHRDIKPANILLHQQQRGWAARMADFGLAKQFERAGFSGMTLTGAIGGTYDYMPREQLTNFKNTLPVSDVWSLGATFYRLLTGSPPRPCPEGRDPMEVVLRDEHVPVRQRDPGLPPALARVIDKSLAIDASDRYQDAGEMHQALKEVLTKS